MSGMIESGRFRVAPGSRPRLADQDSLIAPFYASRGDYRRQLQRHVKALSRLQRVHYAANAHALLVIFQAMDAAGKDGAIAHVMSGLNPQGCEVTSFKHPTESELTRDFLWRAATKLPERGRIGVFNRSYYEEVLIVRVHPELLLSEGVPGREAGAADVWRDRYRSICDFEAHLTRNGTKIVKIFLHLSKDEQRRRFLSRIDEPEKNWKFSMADIEERRFWDSYMEAYEACLDATSTAGAPWFIVPADDKPNARLIVSQIVLDALRELHPQFPKTSKARRAELDTVRAALLAETRGT